MRPAPTPSKGGGRDKGRCRVRIVSPGEKRPGQQRLLLSTRCVVLNSRLQSVRRHGQDGRRQIRTRLSARPADLRRPRFFHLHAARVRQVDGLLGRRAGRPVVGIAFTHSKFNPCHRHFPELLDAIKRGVAAAGGLALEFPTISLHESTLAPNSMKFRNLMAMDTEEMIRAQPMDAVVLMGGCDKTVPAQLMGAASAGKPAIQLIGGPQMTSRYQRRPRGRLHRLPQVLDAVPRRQDGPDRDRGGGGPAGHHRRHLRGDGHGLDHGGHRRGAGHDAAGHGGDPCRACGPAARGGGDGRARRGAGAFGLDARQDHHGRRDRERRARAAGARRLDQRRDPSRRHRRAAGPEARSEAAQRVVRHDAGAGGRQAGRQRVLHGGFLCRRRHRRGAARAEAPAPPRCLTITGETLRERLAAEEGDYVDRRVIKSAAEPLEPQGGLIALFGSLAPDGAIIKRSAATPALFEKTARAVVFSSLEDLGRAHRRSQARRHGGRYRRPAERRPAQRPRPCRKQASCRSPRSCWKRASRTWCASRMRACPARPTAPSCCMWRRRQRSAGRWRWCATGDKIRLSVKERRLDLLVDETELRRGGAWSQAGRTGARARLRQAVPRERYAGARWLRFRVSGSVGLLPLPMKNGERESHSALIATTVCSK